MGPLMGSFKQFKEEGSIPFEDYVLLVPVKGTWR
jgi:hypothetical protein